jgi:hypothetical protein
VTAIAEQGPRAATARATPSLRLFPDQSLIWLLNPTEDGANAQVAVVGAEGLVGIEAVLGSRVAMCDAVVHIPGGTAGVAMSVDAFRCELDRRGALYDLAQQYAANLVRHPTGHSDLLLRSCPRRWQAA